MSLRGIPQGVGVGQFNALNGTPTTVSLTALAAGNVQNSVVCPSDFVFVTAATGSFLSITLPDPNKYGGAVGDSFTIVNSATGQTLNIFPPVGGNISGAGANTANTLANNKVNNYYLVSFTATTSVWTVDAGA
jgi:hypothetical protein